MRRRYTDNCAGSENPSDGTPRELKALDRAAAKAALANVAEPVVRRAPAMDAAEPPVLRADTRSNETTAMPIPKTGLFAKMPSLLKRNPTAPEPAPVPHTDADFGDAAIKAKIAQVIRSRAQLSQDGQSETDRVEPPVRTRHPRGPKPMILAGAQQTGGIPPGPH